jgi:WD40 repeat protein
MTALFISHSGQDREVAVRVRERLRARGYHALFLDFDPTDGIPAGRPWERELYAQLRRTDAVIFLASRHSALSRWCFAELCLARSLNHPVFPVRLDMGVQLDLVNDIQWVDLAEGETAFDRLFESLRRAGLGPADSFAWDPLRSPYPGLEPFDERDAAVFFGRRSEIERLLELFRPSLLRGRGRIVAIAGPSGSGKSSLLRSGLLPRLQRFPDRWVLLPVLLPGREPIANLARSVAAAFARFGQQRPVSELLDRLALGSNALAELASELVVATGGGRRDVLVVIDQAEELATRTSAQEQAAFLSLLRASIHEESPVWAIETIRAEYLSSAPERAGLAETIDDTLLVEPLSRARLSEIIERPAQRAGLDFAPGLVQRIVEDTRGGDALPLLACTLQQLYTRVGRAGTITAIDYEELGGVVGSLQRQADELHSELQRRGQGAAVLPTLLHLVNMDQTGEPTRRRVRRADLTSVQNAIIQMFIDARLLTSRGVGPDVTVEVAHEALLRQWPPLQEAIVQSQQALRLRSEVERLAGDWERGGHDESYLLRGARLAAFGGVVNQHRNELGVLELRYYAASVAAEQRERTAAEERERVRRELQAEGLARSAVLEVNRSPEQAVLQALAAVVGSPSSPSPAVIRSAHTVLDQVRLHRILRGHQDRLGAVAFSPSGGIVLTGSYDGTARLWDRDSGELLRVLRGHDGHVVCVAWAPDGSRVATGSWDNTARVWDPQTGACLATLKGHDGWVSSVAWSPNGTRLATGSRDNTAAVWDVGGRLIQRMTGHTDWVRSAEWRPDGRQLLTGSYDGTAAVWDVRTGRRIRELRGHQKAVPAVRWLPDGTHALTASEDGTLGVWRVTGPELIRTIVVHTSHTYCLDVDPKASRVAAGSEDGSVRIFEIASGVLLDTFPGHGSWISGVAWSSDNDWIASSSGDGTARLAFLPGRTRSTALDRHGSWVSSIRWHPDGTRAARTSGDGTAYLWFVDGSGDGVRIQDLYALCLAWNSDGTRLATGGFDGAVRIIDVERLDIHDVHPHHTDRVTAVDWQPGGRLLATSGEDGTVLVIDANERQIIGQLHAGVAIESVRWSPSGDMVALGGWDNRVYLWHLTDSGDSSDNSDNVACLEGHTAALHDIAWAPNGERLVTTSGDGTARIWSVPRGSRLEGREIGQFAAGEAFAVAWSVDGKFIATGGQNNSVRVWDAASLDLVQILTHTEAIHALDWSPDAERMLVGGEAGGVWLWQVGVACLRRELIELTANLLPYDAIVRLIPDWPISDSLA